MGYVLVVIRGCQFIIYVVYYTVHGITSGSISEIHFSALNCRPFAAQFCLGKKKKETLGDQGDWNPGPERLVPCTLYFTNLSDGVRVVAINVTDLLADTVQKKTDLRRIGCGTNVSNYDV